MPPIMGLPLEKLALAAFLEWENTQDTRNEFYRGDVFAMVGARRSHDPLVTRARAAACAPAKSERMGGCARM